MRIWIDGFEANVPQRLGSSQVAFELLKNLEKIDKKNSYTVFLASPPLADLPKERQGWNYHLIKIKRFKTWIGLPWSLYSAKDKPDLFFSPSHYGPMSSPVKKVITIFDLAFLRFPQTYKKRDLWQLKLWTYLSAKSAAHIITISEATKQDIEKAYGIASSKITAAYPGFKSQVYKPVGNKTQIEEVKKKYKIAGPYLIYVGTIQPRKNLMRLIEAFKNIEKVKLVIVGKTTGLGRQGWKFQEILDKPKELGIEERVIFTGFAPDEDLKYLINGSLAFILPSLWEGFGIPVVDAMACGVPVLTSNVSSLPEVVGDAGLTFDPYSIKDMESKILEVINNSKLREELIKKGLKRVNKFSWEKMAQKVLEVFENV